jgi:hypothetical protein
MNMSSVTAFFFSPTFVDAIILLLIVETVIVCGIRYRSYTQTWWRPVANNIAGIFLLLALRSIIAGAPHFWMLLALSGALIAHLADLRTQIPHQLVRATTAPKGI